MSDLTLYIRRHSDYSLGYTFFEEDPYGDICVEFALQEFLDKTVLTPELLRQAADILEQHLKEG